MFIGAFGFGICELILAPVHATLVAGLLLFVCGIFFTSYTANSNAAIQLASPDYIRGRVLGLYYYAWNGLAPLGALLVGWLCDRRRHRAGVLRRRHDHAPDHGPRCRGCQAAAAQTAAAPARRAGRGATRRITRPKVVGSRSFDQRPSGHERCGDGASRIRSSQQDLSGRHTCRQRHQSRHQGRGVHGPRRAVRLRQDNRAAHGRRPRGDLRRCAEDRRPGREPRPVPRPGHRHGLPELRALPASLGLREHRLRPAAEEDVEGRHRRARQARLEPARPRRVPEAQAARALRRPATARRDGPRDRARARGVPDGRAALEPRREAARADARGDRKAAERPRRDDDLRHPRPDRGHDDGRPRRRHAQGRAAAGRRPADALRPARQPLRRRLHRQPRDEHARLGDRRVERRHRRQGRRRRRSRSVPRRSSSGPA